MGAVLATLLATLLAKWVALVRVRSILRCKLTQVLPWRSLASILGIATAAALPCLLVESALRLPALASLLILGAVYTTSYCLLLWFIGPLSGYERHTILQWLQAPAARAGGSRRA
jgi:hypothetical protein